MRLAGAVGERRVARARKPLQGVLEGLERFVVLLEAQEAPMLSVTSWVPTQMWSLSRRTGPSVAQFLVRTSLMSIAFHLSTAP